MNTGTWGLYYNYTWWGNAIQTAPSVIGKPDFFGSQFLMLTSQQPNQIVNGDFATDSDWVKGTNWSIANDKASADGSSQGLLSQLTPSITSGSKYIVSFDVTDYLAGNIRFYFAGAFTDFVSSNGSYSQVITTTNTDNSIVSSINTPFNGSITNISVQLVRADNVEAVKCLADWIHETQILDV